MKTISKRPRRLMLAGDLPKFKMPADSPTGGFEGYGAVYGNTDRDEEILAPGVFAESLPSFLRDGFIAEGHDWKRPVATVAAAREDDYGLMLAGVFHSDVDSQGCRIRTAERLERGQSVGLSVGFRPEVWEYDEEKDQITITKGELFEVSIVTVPANPLARIVGAKSAPWYDLPETEREFEGLLRELGYTKSEATAIASHGFKAFYDRRDSASSDEVAQEELRFLLEQGGRILAANGIPT